MRYKMLVTALLLGTAPVLVPTAASAAPIISVTGDGSNLTNPPFTLGFEFTTSQTFRLIGLGVFDQGDDGLAESHEVGLWNAGGTLLASTTVQAGTASTLVSRFRYESVASQILAAGTYRVGALFLSGADPNFFPGEGVATTIAGVTYDSGAFAAGATLADPTTTGAAASSYIGPNVNLAAIPEPATWAMLIVGFGLIGGLARRRVAAVRTTVRFT